MESKQKLLNMFGLARRAGKLVWGFDAAVSAVRNNEAKGLFACIDISEKTFKNLVFEAERSGVKAVRIDVPLEEMSLAIGKHAGVFAVSDEGFCNKLFELAAALNQEE